MCERSYQLNPAAPLWYADSCIENYFFTGRMKDFIEALKRTGSWKKGQLGRHDLLYKAVAEAELGLDDLTATVAEFKRRFPESSFEGLVNSRYIFERKQEEDRFLTAVRRSGIRICATEQELAALTQTPRRLAECSAKLTD